MTSAENTPPANTTREAPKPRWWPAVVFLGLTVLAIAWIQLFSNAQQQDRNLQSYMVGILGYACLLLWLVVLSRLRARVRLTALALAIGLPGLLAATLRIRGVDGNLVPIFELRWSQAPKPLASDDPEAEPGAVAISEALELTGWPQFLGPNRDCTVAAVPLNRDWNSNPPVEVWRVPVGPAWSGFAVQDGYAVTMEQEGDRELVSCFNARTGQRLWTHAYEARYATTLGGEGPRSTPTIDGGSVYATGATGWVTCLDLQTGEVRWSRDVFAANHAQVPDWGYSISPLVVGERVIVGGGSGGRSSLIALDRQSGEILWTGGIDDISYSSPILHDFGGGPQVVSFNTSSVAGHDPASGELLWQHPYAHGHVHVAAPLAVGSDRVLFSSGYGHGSELFRVGLKEENQWEAEQEWKSRRMKAKFTNLILHEGHVYGMDDGIMACISVENGEQRWKDGRYGHGQAILVGEVLLISTESGELVLVDPDPDELKELTRVAVFDGKTWNPPALAGHHLFLRTDQEAVCLELPME